MDNFMDFDYLYVCLTNVTVFLMLPLGKPSKSKTTFFVTNVTNRVGGGLETNLSQKITMSQNHFLAN